MSFSSDQPIMLSVIDEEAKIRAYLPLPARSWLTREPGQGGDLEIYRSTLSQSHRDFDRRLSVPFPGRP